MKLPFEKIKRKILVKKESTTDETKGCKPEDRPIEELIRYGVVNIDKPKGPTKFKTSEVPIRFQTMFKRY